ncbi:DUF1059 domain-containing protein [Planosporangium mesophilum]|uniref:DUF1059 domain-containing protein n=1 Tax=Planosporangium mesophilum TaxID=689768 RepID=A0A8J3TGD4_9ACTN|nr:DUF1059 domain-containing protein [Planosporangium mesophilum]NJC81944.1 DUF1059 domain-containing protein [Planosporangium mesophilum]GII25292.1 hypothetical protein Pme01_48890 [Planosporangium mesophilum]
MKKFRCGDIIPGCDASYTGDEASILASCAVHATKDHGLPEFSPELAAQVRAAMVDVAD